MQIALDHFRTSIARVRHLPLIYGHVAANPPPGPIPGLDLTDILRAQVVLAVSALDYYVHEVTRLGLIEIFEGKRPVTSHYLKYQVSLESVHNALAAPGTIGWVDTEIRTKHGFVAFQQADKIADAIRLFSPVKLWNNVGARIGIVPEDIRTRIDLIVHRRNKIAHEADLDPSYPNARWPIRLADATYATDFIERICENIHPVVIC